MQLQRYKAEFEGAKLQKEWTRQESSERQRDESGRQRLKSSVKQQ